MIEIKNTQNEEINKEKSQQQNKSKNKNTIKNSNIKHKLNLIRQRLYKQIM